MRDERRPRVGISRCLLGDEVRHDGGHKHEPRLVAELGRFVDWISVCPEVEIGMGVPREPIRLVSRREAVRLIGVTSGEDWTERMDDWARRRVGELASLGLSGYVLKSRSPSCGVRDVPVHSPGDDIVSVGPGRFAAVLRELMPGLPIEDEDRLRDRDVRRRFLDRVLSCHRDAG